MNAAASCPSPALSAKKITKAEYSYGSCLENAYKVNWRIEEVLDGRDFDDTRRWLPSRLSAADTSGLDAETARMLSHLEMAAYAHLFGYVEEFVTPTISELALDHQANPDRNAFEALTNFAAEEVKHMTLFRRIRDQIDAGLGFRLQLLGDQQETVKFVMGKNRGAVLLLTAAIEWLTQQHYRECFAEDEELDGLTRRVFKCHWLEESQHAKMDHLETLRYFAEASEAEKEAAVDDLIVLVGAVDGLIQVQSRYDVDNLEQYRGRKFSDAEGDALYAEILKAKRYTFIESGVTHPRFVALFEEVTTAAQREKVAAALAGILGA